MIKTIICSLIISVATFGGLGFLVFMCSKHKCSLKYQTKKKKFEIIPIRDIPKLPPKQSDE